MGYTNVQADVNFYRQSLNADGVKYVTGPYTSLYEDVFRAVTVTTDSVVSVTSYVGDSLSNQFLLAGTEIYGLFSSVTIHSGKAVLHLAGASYISETINQYSATGIPLGFYEEGTQCLSQKISALLTQGVFDDASWVMVPSQYEEDWVRAFKPTSELGNLAFTRSSDATFTDSTGVVRRSPWNLVQFSEEFDNAYWTKSGTTISANVAIAPNGTLTADKLIPVVPSGQKILLRQNVFVADGQTRSWSIYVKGDGYRYVAIGEASIIDNSLIFDTTTGTYTQGSINQYFTSILTPVNAGNGWWRIGYSTNLNSAFYDNFNLYVTNSPTGAAASFSGDGTSGILVWGAQLVEGTEALPYFATTDRLNVPRLDYRNADGTLSTCPRLLLEPQRTNSIRNSSMVGAVAGGFGTLPTNWGVTSGGLTQTIVGTGTENGLPYIDFRFNGTATGASALVSFEGTTNIAAANAQVWTNSFYFKTISEPNPPVSYNLYSVQRISGSAAGAFQNPFTPTTTLARYSQTFTTNNASVNSVQPYFFAAINIGAAYDFTIRIAAPQMELGAYATTWVPTTTAAVTRLTDLASKTGVSSLIGQTEGTILLDFIFKTPQVISGGQISIANLASPFNRVLIWNNNTLNVLAANLQVNGSNIFNTSLGTFVDGQRYKIAIAYKSGSNAAYVNGTQVFTNSNTFTFAASLSQIIVGTYETGLNAHQLLNQAALFPVRLDNATLAALTTL